MDPRSGLGPDTDLRHPCRLAAVERVVAALRAEPAAHWPLGEMAEVAGWSLFHFARVFKTVVGVSPGAFHAALRIERAKRLLLTTDLPVIEVCFESGYDGLGSFTSRFGRCVGVSPARLRRLPEATAAALAAAGRERGPWPRPISEPGVVRGRVLGPRAPGTLIFVGLFAEGIARGWPVAGMVLPAPGAFDLGPAPDGRYRLLAVALPVADDPVAALLPGATTLVGAAPGPVEIRRGHVTGRCEVGLRPPLPTDAPILIALPALLPPNAAGRG